MLPSSANPFPFSSTAIQRASRISSALSDSFISTPCVSHYSVCRGAPCGCPDSGQGQALPLRFFLKYLLQFVHQRQLRRVFVEAAGAAHHLAPAGLAALAAPLDPFLFRELVSAIPALHIKTNYEV